MMVNLKPVSLYAVIDPHWGEPEVIPETLSTTEQGAIDKALVHPEHTIWSGASLNHTPIIKGKWENLQRQGYMVRLIKLSEQTPADAAKYKAVEEAIADVLSHASSWRNALMIAQALSRGDNVSYWTHEIAAHERVVAQLKGEL